MRRMPSRNIIYLEKREKGEGKMERRRKYATLYLKQ
jgi:hypothetical protein